MIISLAKESIAGNVGVLKVLYIVYDMRNEKVKKCR